MLREQRQCVVHQPAHQRLLGQVQMVLRGPRLGEDNLTLRYGILALFQRSRRLRQFGLGSRIDAAQQRLGAIRL